MHPNKAGKLLKFASSRTRSDDAGVGASSVANSPKRQMKPHSPTKMRPRSEDCDRLMTMTSLSRPSSAANSPKKLKHQSPAKIRPRSEDCDRLMASSRSTSVANSPKKQKEISPRTRTRTRSHEVSTAAQSPKKSKLSPAVADKDVASQAATLSSRTRTRSHEVNSPSIRHALFSPKKSLKTDNTISPYFRSPGPSSASSRSEASSLNSRDSSPATSAVVTLRRKTAAKNTQPASPAKKPQSQLANRDQNTVQQVDIDVIANSTIRRIFDKLTIADKTNNATQNLNDNNLDKDSNKLQCKTFQANVLSVDQLDFAALQLADYDASANNYLPSSIVGQTGASADGQSSEIRGGCRPKVRPIPIRRKVAKPPPPPQPQQGAACDIGDIESLPERWQPHDWQVTLAKIRTMRKHRDANVDRMGCQKCYDPDADAKTQRFQILIALVLSSQTKDSTTFHAIRRLINVGCTPDVLVELSDEELQRLLSPVSFYKMKSKYIRGLSRILIDEYDSDIPITFEGLRALPGVGPKVAHICMSVAWNVTTGIGVDTHVHRISKRLNWTEQPTASEEKTRIALESWLPRSLWAELNPLLVGFGQTICLPRHPLCADCLHADHCPSKGVVS